MVLNVAENSADGNRKFLKGSFLRYYYFFNVDAATFRVHSNNTWHSRGGGSRLCHQITHGEGREGINQRVTWDFFVLFLNNNFPFWDIYCLVSIFFGKCHVTRKGGGPGVRPCVTKWHMGEGCVSKIGQKSVTNYLNGPLLLWLMLMLLLFSDGEDKQASSLKSLSSLLTYHMLFLEGVFNWKRLFDGYNF